MNSEHRIIVCGCHHCLEPKPDHSPGSHREWIEGLASAEAFEQLKVGETIELICGSVRCQVVADGCLGKCRDRPRALIDGQPVRVGSVIDLQDALNAKELL